jgi:hypothetical protein
MALQEDLAKLQRENTDREIANPQTLWKIFKQDAKDMAKKPCKESRTKISRRIEHIKKDLHHLTNHPDIDTDKGIRANEAFLASELGHLEKTRACDHKDDNRASLAYQGEKLGGAWSAINKERKPRDLIYRLKIPNLNPPTYERESRRMAKLARDYHETLQLDGLSLPADSPEHMRRTREILSEIPANQQLTEEANEEIEWEITRDQVKKALHLAKNGSATGVDGCPYELWKKLNSHFLKAEESEKDGFDIVSVLTTIFSYKNMEWMEDRTSQVDGCARYTRKRTQLK